jgi:hypothetical protein
MIFSCIHFLLEIQIPHANDWSAHSKLLVPDRKILLMTPFRLAETTTIYLIAH